MPSLSRTLPLALSLAVAFATPFIAVACGDVSEVPGPIGSVTSGGSVSAGASSGASGTGGAGGTAGTSSVSASASSTSAAASTSGSGGSGGVATESTASSGGAVGSGGMSFDAGNVGDAMTSPDAAPSCGTIVTPYAVDPSPHVTECFPVVYSSNPPTSGPHYPYWASFKTYTTPIQRGFTVHDLEHGAIVISYKCSGGCATELAALQAFVDARPADPACVAPVKSRIVIVPDPLLDVPFAAAAWGFALTSQCFDLVALGAFIDAHYAMGPENFCFDGVDVTAADAGIPADCGEASDAGAGPG